MSQFNPNPGASIEMPKKAELSLDTARRRKFFTELKQDFAEGDLDTRSHKFTDNVLKHALGYQRFAGLTAAERAIWYTRVDRLIVNKFGGHNQAGWLEKLAEEKKKKSEKVVQAETNQEPEEQDDERAFLNIENLFSSYFTSD